jgi:hypothetical protein
LEQFISEYGVDIFLLNRTHVESGRALRFTNYVCHRTHCPTRGGSTGLSVRNGLLLCTQFIRPTIDCVCPIWRSAARSYVQKLQVLQYKCHATLYVRNRQIHEDLWIPFFVDHIRALTESFASKIANAGNPLVRQNGRHLRRPKADWSHPRVTEVH